MIGAYVSNCPCVGEAKSKECDPHVVATPLRATWMRCSQDVRTARGRSRRRPALESSTSTYRCKPVNESINADLRHSFIMVRVASAAVSHASGGQCRAHYHRRRRHLGRRAAFESGPDRRTAVTQLRAHIDAVATVGGDESTDQSRRSAWVSRFFEERHRGGVAAGLTPPLSGSANNVDLYEAIVRHL